MPLSFQFCGLSDIGNHRQTNQDVWIAHPHLGFFALADGMGGRKGGDLAAKLAIDSLSQSLHELASSSNFFQHPLDLTYELQKAIEQAHSWIYQLGTEQRTCFGMGTTLCCLLWTPELVIYAHVGDSRIYRYRDKQLQRLTTDHSLLARWESQKRPSRLPPPPKHIITRAVGLGGRANPEIASSPFLPNDLFLLCSDGLSDALTTPALEEILSAAPTLDEAATLMIERAKNQGSHDNITVLIVRPHS